jgi:hypothetical protein
VLSGLSQRARAAVLGVASSVAAFFLFGGGGGGGGSQDPFDAVPRDSFVVATMNLAELRRSPLHDVLLGKESTAHAPRTASAMFDAKALGIGKLADACGFDPLSRVEQLALAVPEEGDKGELGLAARVTVSESELSGCASALAGRRGGKVETKDVGSFVVVEDPASESAARPRLAYGRGGLLVTGRGAWFDAMLEVADHKKPGAREAAAHAAMRHSLTSREGWHSPTIVVSALLPRALRDRIKSEMGAELGAAEPAGPETRPEAKPRDSSQHVMAGVLGVSTVGVALKAGASGQNVDAAVELMCDSEEACASVEKLILKKRFDWSKELMLRMVGFGPLLDSIDVKREGVRIRVTAGAPADALAATLDRVLRLKARRQDDAGRDEGRQPDPRTLPARSSDEVIPAAPRPSASAR